MAEELEQRKQKVFEFIKNKRKWLIILALIVIISFSFYVRTLPVKNLQGKYLIDPDAHLFLRYAQYINEHGTLYEKDPLRYYPLGFNTKQETIFLPYFVVFLYKISKIFSPNITLEYVDIIFPAITFIFTLIFFYLLVRHLFNYKVALISTAFLSVIPSFLFRTLSGVSDKESLAMPFMFAAFYFYVAAWQSKKLYKVLLFGALAGISTMFMGLSWGGDQFVVLIISMFAILLILLNKFSRKDYYIYLTWFISNFLLFSIVAPGRFSPKSFIDSLPYIPPLFALILTSIDQFIIKRNLLRIKEKFNKYPEGLLTFVSTIIVSLLLVTVIRGPGYIFSKIEVIIQNLTAPFGTSRWGLTVAEAHQPYIVDWINDFGTIFFYLILIGSVILFYEAVKENKNKKWLLTTIYAIAMLFIIFSRYSSNSILNGTSFLAKLFYFGSLVAFPIFLYVIFYKSFKKDKELYDNILGIDKKYFFIFIWFLMMIIAARGGIRLIFVLVPIAVLLVSYLVGKTIDFASSLNKKIYKIGIYVVVLIFLVVSLNGYAKTVTSQASNVGPIFHFQWQNAAKWVENSTSENDVFVHWWDYGYLVQTGFKRPTVTDGGNAAGSWNYFVSRYVLTAPNETDALEFGKAHDVKYLLIVSDEIGKYPAYSSIGSDENYDRYSFLPVFSLDLKNTQETRNQTVYFYGGGFPLDEDLIYDNKVLPRGSAGIGGILLPAQKISQDTIDMKQPTAIVVYNNQRFDLPMECVFLNGREITFPNAVIKGCLRIIPTIDSQNNLNPIGAGIYLSPRVRNTLFTKLYLYGQDTEHIKVAYSDEQQVPLAIYQGRLIGPLKIWEFTYPDTIKVNPIFLSTEFPNPNVTIPKPFY